MHLSEGLVIGEVVLCLPAHATVHLTCHITLVSMSHRTEVVLVTIAVVTPECEVNTQTGTELQTWQDIEFCIE